MEGEGKQTNVGGTVLEGEWREGKVYNGNGVLMHPSGDMYEGI